MSVRGVRLWRRTDPTMPPSIMIEHSKNDHCLLFENNACVTITQNQFEEWKRGYVKISDAYGLMGILRTSKDESFLIIVNGVLSAGQLYNSDIYKVTMTEFLPLRTIGTAENIDARIPELQKLISSGMFYFSASSDFDLTLTAQKRAEGKESDHRFFWNRSLHFPLQRFGIDSHQWLLKCMSGSVMIRTVYVGHRTGKVAILSRLSCERVGTRFNVRGANDQGYVANFVETEQLITFENQESSFVQIRGSIPLFWDQPGIQVGSHKVKLRAFEACAPAYQRHFYQLNQRYGNVVVINLLGHKEGERTMADAFRTQHKNSRWKEVPFVDFDYHAQMKVNKDNINYLKTKLQAHLADHGFFHIENGIVKRKQSGVHRTNCLDCLDRTNCVQTVLGLQILRQQVAEMNIESAHVNMQQRFEEIVKEIWVKNGDQCSIIYAGTGALEGKSKFKDASRSLARTLQNNLMDQSKQESFDLFLSGTAFENTLFDRAVNLLPSSLILEYTEAVEQIVDRSTEITHDAPIKIFCGTWNVNGGKNMTNVAFRNQEKLSDWIFAEAANLVSVSDLDDAPDIVAIGLEELVDLNASNMMKASTTNQRLWLDGLRKTLHEKAPYVLLGCEQLMGVCLFLFIRPRLAPYLKDFAVGSVKTGMGGATANKGSVAFRIVIHSTSICFVCSHFAAGQNEIRDRNEDFFSALRKIRFPQGRDIGSQDVVFWVGDFNYRISMGREDVKRAVAMNNYEELVPNDQLTHQRLQGSTFVGFEEGPLTFAPTYKYDTFSDDYDTSEKCRVPAWTDRILWKDQRGKRAGTRLLNYNRAELKTSDHRPVYATFLMNAYKVDWDKCEQLVEDVVSCMGPPDGTVVCSLTGISPFPPDAINDVIVKAKELNIQLLTSKLDQSDLWLIFASGECALAALSMDGLKLRNGWELNVRLRSPDWCDSVSPRLAAYDVAQDVFDEKESEIVNADAAAFIFDDDDEEVKEVMQLSRMAPPERPRPPSRTDRPTSAVQIPTSKSTSLLDDCGWSCESNSVPHLLASSAPPRRIAPPTPSSRPLSALPVPSTGYALSHSQSASSSTNSMNNHFQHSTPSTVAPWVDAWGDEHGSSTGTSPIPFVPFRETIPHVSSVPNMNKLGTHQNTNHQRPFSVSMTSTAAAAPKVPPRPKLSDLQKLY